MKRIIPLLVVCSFLLWIGCGGDDGPTDNGETPLKRLTADTMSAPTLSSPDESVWDNVDSVVVPVSGSNAPKLRPPSVAAIPPEVMVKAIKKGGQLYLRLQWSDATFDAYPDNFEVDRIDMVPFLDEAVFKQNQHTFTEEDQVFVLFGGFGEAGYDVWNWRVLTTGGAGLGKGYTYVASILVEDDPGTANDSATIPNPMTPSQRWPTYGPDDPNQFDGYIFYADDTVHYQHVLDSVFNSIEQRWEYVYFYNRSGWAVGQKVPGWLIDSSFVSLSKQAKGSRWDIKTVSEYDDGANEYHVVLCRELSTGFSDDLVLEDSVKVRIGIYDSQDDFKAGSPNRGFSDDFWIVLP